VCPVCGSASTDVLFVVSNHDVARHFFSDERDPRSHRLADRVETLWHQRTCKFLHCPRCDFSFADPFTAGDDEFYRIAYGEGTTYPEWKWEFRRTLDEIESLCRASPQGPLSLLEIGAGNGTFVKRIAPRWIEKESVTCVEFSEPGVAAIRDYGIRCLSQDVRGIENHELGGPFDVVCLFQVLEHLDGLDHFFARLMEVTRKGSHVFLAVPNPLQRAFFDSYGLYQDLPPAHVGRWTPAPLGVIAARHGLRIVATEVQPEGLSSKALKFSLLRLRSCRVGGFIDRIHARWIRRLLRSATLPPIVLLSIGALISLRSQELGTALWIHLRRQDERDRCRLSS